MKYAVRFEQTATGYSAHIPDLPGCAAGGATLAETTDLIRHAIALQLAGMREDGESIPEPRTIAEYIVAAWFRIGLRSPRFPAALRRRFPAQPRMAPGPVRRQMALDTRPMSATLSPNRVRKH